MNEFDKFDAKEGESLESVYERLSTLVNVMDRNDVRHIKVNIQTKNAGYGGNGNRNARRQNKNQVANARSGQVYARDHYARDFPKPKVCEAKYLREQMLLAMKDEARGTLNDEENDFMFDNAYENETLEELAAAVIMMEGIQPANNNAETKPKYDTEAVKNNGRTVKHASNVHDQSFDIESMEFETCKERVQTLEFISAQCSRYKERCDDLERKIRTNKDTIKRILKEKDTIERDFFISENEKVIIQHETQLAKKAFKARENSYLEDIVDLEDKKLS
uniref:Uncharacterized protein n=1 Tax=Tanacetum cinerariifolium TaxID=118510 RepID=A0A6L2LRZ9_TANCI|nr:hypothetical protein [Tanacetum cinerariifolium]